MLSFGRGKCVTLGDGGALLVLDPACAGIGAAETRGGEWRGAGRRVVALGLAPSAHPVAFGLLSRLPGARIGESCYEPEFAERRLPAVSDGLAAYLVAAIARQLTPRVRCAAAWHEALKRVPVLASDPSRREALVSHLAGVGLTFVRSYPAALSGIAGFRPHLAEDRAVPGAETLAGRLLALPCHAAVTPGTVRRAVEAMRGAGTSAE